MELIEGSETSAFKPQTPGKYPKENILRITNNTGSRQTTGIQEELDTTCKQNASRQTTQDNETLFPNWQKKSWKTSEETSRYVRPERVNKWPNSMTDI